MVATRTRKVTPSNKTVSANGAAGKKKKAAKTAKNGAKSPGRPSKKSVEPKKTKASSDEEQYDVEEVRGVMVKGSVTSYFIKWSGYAERDNSWEPANNVSCEDLVRKFLQKALDNVKDAGEDESA